MNNQEGSHSSNFNAELKLKGFKVYEICATDSTVRNYNRKDFYKICLNTGKNIIRYADRSFETDGPVLFFGNPHIPYSWETISSTYTGYACLFTEDFLSSATALKAFNNLPYLNSGARQF